MIDWWIRKTSQCRSYGEYMTINLDFRHRFKRYNSLPKDNMLGYQPKDDNASLEWLILQRILYVCAKKSCAKQRPCVEHRILSLVRIKILNGVDPSLLRSKVIALQAWSQNITLGLYWLEPFEVLRISWAQGRQRTSRFTVMLVKPGRLEDVNWSITDSGDKYTMRSKLA